MSIAAVSPTPPVPLPTTATPAEVVANNAAFQQSLLQTPSDATQVPGPAPSDAFQNYLTDTYLGVSSVAAPNPFGTTLSGLELGSPAYYLPAYLNPFAQHGLGINVSALL